MVNSKEIKITIDALNGINNLRKKVITRLMNEIDKFIQIHFNKFNLLYHINENDKIVINGTIPYDNGIYDISCTLNYIFNFDLFISDNNLLKLHEHDNNKLIELLKNNN